jgi:hypothetical protein
MPNVITRAALAVVLTTAGLAVPSAQPQIRYDAVGPSHLAKLSSGYCSLETSLKLLPTKMNTSPTGRWTAMIEQTDPVVVPYDRAQACLKLSNATRVIRGVAISDFRSLRLTWVNDRLLYIFTDVGHAAGVGQLLDVDDGKWIYAKTEYYPDVTQTGPPAPRVPDAVVIEAAKKTIVQDIEPKLPKATFEEWLRGLVGPQPKMVWGVNDCGEQTGNPAQDKGRDFPMCAEVMVTLGTKHTLDLYLAMGTFGKGLTGKPPVLWMGLLSTPDGKQQWIKTLAEVPPLLVKRANMKQ